MSQGACSDHSPQGGATEHHAPEQVFKRFASCSNAMTEEGSVCINSSDFSSRIDMNSACKDSIVRCIGMIVASNFSRNGRNAASIAAVIICDKSAALACEATGGSETGFGICTGALWTTPAADVRHAWAATTTPSRTSFFGAASQLRSPTTTLAHDLGACIGVSARLNFAARSGRGGWKRSVVEFIRFGTAGLMTANP